MKTVFVTAGSNNNPIQVTVQLNGYEESELLTPSMARSAARIGVGHTSSVTISDGKTAYRITRGSGTRKITIESEEE